MENPKYPYKEHPTVAFCFECPNCGDPIPWQVVWLMNDYWHGLKHCPNCGAALPDGETREEALAAAMKRDRAKGYLAYRAGHHWEEDGTDYPDICVYVKGYCSECGQVLCRAGETTIHYPDELMYTDKEWDYRKELIEAEDKLLEAATQRKVSIVNFCPNCGADMREAKDNER